MSRAGAMHVVATAGHVDHGKSTLVRLLTGMEPDRWAEERRRGLTIDLGFAWTRLPTGEQLAFVDVPGHERFVPNMLAGVGPAPAVLFVVAADAGWAAQSAEHLAALDALGVRHGLLAVTRSDLADPAPARERALAELAATSLETAEAVAVSGRTGAGLPELRAALARLVGGLPAPDTAADVRLWVDRAFTVRGAGTVVTGTLAAGAIRTGDVLELARATGEVREVRVRGLQALGEDAAEVRAVARVAVNLRGVDRDEAARGDALLTPARWRHTDTLDVRLTSTDLPEQLVLHVGAAAVPARLRPLGGQYARLHTARPLPLRTGDRLLLRDPGRHAAAAGATVLDVRPPALRRRGAAARRAADLASVEPADLTVRDELFVRTDELTARGLPGAGIEVGRWRVDEARWTALPAEAGAAYERWKAQHQLEAGIPEDELRRALALPDPALLPPVLAAAGLVAETGRVHPPRPGGLPDDVETAVRAIEADLAQRPFQAPDADRLSALGLGPKQLAAAVKAGRLLKVADGIILLPGADDAAADLLDVLPQPFTASQARQALDTTRRVAVPLLELLDRNAWTTRHPDGTRTMRQ